MKSLTAWLLAASASLALAAPSASNFKVDKRYVEVRDDITYNVFEHAATGTKMSYVKNSGICETTPGVNQYSGYLTVGTNMNMWFWYVLLASYPGPEVSFLLTGVTGSSRLVTTPARRPWQPGSTVGQAAAR
jgi:hypothetical protein